LSVFFYSCSETSSLEQGQFLYDGAKIHIQADPKISKSQEKNLRTELNNLLRPTPNGDFLGIRFKLLIYNAMGKPKGKGLRNLVRNKLGEPPVLASYSAMEKNRAILQNRLENRGYFKDTVMLDTVYKGKKLSANYTAVIRKQYLIRNITFPSDPDSLSQNIARTAKRSLLKKGEPYNLDVIKNERARIDTRLKQKGFYYFSADNLLIRADSTVGDQQVDMNLIVKKSTPPEAEKMYRINNIVVFANYNAHSDTSIDVATYPKFWDYTIIDSEKMFKPEIFTRALIFKSGDLYNRRDHDLSLNRLISLGVFKFVKIRFDEKDTAQNKLNAYYYLTPTEKKSIRFEVSGLTQSNDANGGQVSVNWRNRNIFRGAELFTTSAYVGFLRQYLGPDYYTNTTKFGVQASLFVPRIIGPVHFQTNSSYIPKTRFNVGYEYFDQSGQYTLNSIKASMAYVWKESVINEHTLEILAVTLVNPTHIDSSYQLQLDTNIVLARSIEKAFIIGPTYNFNINTQLKPNRNRNNFYFNANVDLSSNIAGLVSGADIKNGKQKKIFDVPYAQYVRGEIDFRHYLNFTRNTVLVNRFTGGIGYAYGNSYTMPFIKEFFAGGANDLRAFHSRSLGPGSYYAGNRDTASIADQPGDIKLELNSELRFKLFSVFRWAFFVDAGNTWTVRYDSSRVGSQFTSNWLNQIAIGVGTGLRVDVSILVLRLDYGIPVREPYLAPNNQWVFDTKNSVINFAIGYPF
jgi:outer membrane protein insertion porin family